MKTKSLWELSLEVEIGRIRRQLDTLQRSPGPTSRPGWWHDPPAGVEIIPPWPEDHDGATDIYMDGMYRRHFRTKTVQHRRWQKELE